MDLDSLLRALQATAVALTIRENDTLFPWIESVHVLAITLVVGSIAIVDLRLIGMASLDRAVSRMTASILPCTWTAFAVALLSGALLFSSKAYDYAHNPYFQTKFIFMALAGINMAVFHLFANRGVERWGTPLHATPLQAKAAGIISLLLWIGVVGFGRWVGFTLEPHASAG